MKKTRRVVRKRKQKGGGIKPATLLTVLAAYVLTQNGQEVTAKSIKAKEEKLGKNEKVIKNLKNNNIEGAIEASISDKILDLTKTVEKTDTAIYKGISDWFFQKAQEIESQGSLAPLTDFMSYDTEGSWVGDQPSTPTPTPTPTPSLEEGKVYTVNGKIPDAYRPFRSGDKAIFKEMSKNNDAYVVTRVSDNPEEAPEYTLLIEDVTLTPVANNGAGKTRRKNVRRKK
jgi:hypothetical protein